MFFHCQVLITLIAGYLFVKNKMDSMCLCFMLPACPSFSPCGISPTVWHLLPPGAPKCFWDSWAFFGNSASDALMCGRKSELSLSNACSQVAKAVIRLPQNGWFIVENHGKSESRNGWLKSRKCLLSGCLRTSTLVEHDLWDPGPTSVCRKRNWRLRFDTCKGCTVWVNVIIRFRQICTLQNCFLLLSMDSKKCNHKHLITHVRIQACNAPYACIILYICKSGKWQNDIKW